jgi:hypothetical protein
MVSLFASAGKCFLVLRLSILQNCRIGKQYIGDVYERKMTNGGIQDRKRVIDDPILLVTYLLWNGKKSKMVIL